MGKYGKVWESINSGQPFINISASGGQKGIFYQDFLVFSKGICRELVGYHEKACQ